MHTAKVEKTMPVCYTEGNKIRKDTGIPEGGAMQYIKIADAKGMDFDVFLRRLWRSVRGDIPVDPEDSEYESWEKSLPKLIGVLKKAGLSHITLAAECELPTGGRIDAVLLGYSASDGKPLAVLVEMKQWSRDKIQLAGRGYTSIRVSGRHGNYQSIHPACQTEGYMQYMERNHRGVTSGRLRVESCQYLFNYDAAGKEELFKRDFEIYRSRQAQMFCKGEEARFESFLSGLFSDREQDNQETLSLFFDSGYQISDLDMEAFRDIAGRPENISLLEDQRPITACIDMAVERLLRGTLEGKNLFLISGAAGTGKTIVGFKILSDYCEMYRRIRGRTDYNCAYTLPRSRTIKAVLKGVGGGVQVVFLNDLRQRFELLVVDEAHRATDFSMSAGGVGNALKQAKIVVVLQDNRQRVLGNEIGTAERYREFARANGFALQSYELRLQKRAGFGGYVERIDRLLYGGPAGEVKENGIEVTICDSLSEMEELVQKKYQSDKSIKYYAPYCWEWKSRDEETAIDIVISEDGAVFQKQWNPQDDQYQWYLDSVDRVGCIYTAQGLGFNYVALLWWDDLRWDKSQGKWSVDFNKVTRYDRLLKGSLSNGADNDFIMLNIYRVLLTRAKKGVYIWFKDPDTREHFREVVLQDKSKGGNDGTV